MNTRGRITHFGDGDGIGRIMLDDGTELRFGRSACVGVEPAVGLEVWVPQTAKHPLGGMKALAVHGDASGYHSPVELAKLRGELDEQLNAKLTSVFKQASFEIAAHDRVPHVDETLRALGIEVHTAVLGDSSEETLGFYYEPHCLLASTPFDPRFIAFGGSEADAFGFFCEPALMSEGAPPPVVFCDHEERGFSYEAGTFDAFLRARATSHEQRVWLRTQGYDFETEDAYADAAKSFAPRWRALLSTNIDFGVGEQPLTTLARLIEQASSWPSVLVQRAELQLNLVHREHTNRALIERIRQEHYLAHPDIYLRR